MDWDVKLSPLFTTQRAHVTISIKQNGIWMKAKSKYIPECPPNVETHYVQPEKCRQKEEMHRGCCKRKETIQISSWKII